MTTDRLRLPGKVMLFGVVPLLLLLFVYVLGKAPNVTVASDDTALSIPSEYMSDDSQWFVEAAGAEATLGYVLPTASVLPAGVVFSGVNVRPIHEGMAADMVFSADGKFPDLLIADISGGPNIGGDNLQLTIIPGNSLYSPELNTDLGRTMAVWWGSNDGEDTAAQLRWFESDKTFTLWTGLSKDDTVDFAKGLTVR